MKKLSFLICISLCLTVFSACADTKVLPDEGATVVPPDSVVADTPKTSATDETFEDEKNCDQETEQEAKEYSDEDTSDGSPQGITATGQAVPEYITENQAKIEAVKHTGYFDYGMGDIDEMTEEDFLGWMSVSVKNIETDLLNKNRNMVYNVKFEIGYYDFDYDIDAQTGEPVCYSKKFNSENVSPDYDGIKAEFELSDEHIGTVDGVIVESDSKFNDEYLFAAEFVNEIYRFLYSQSGTYDLGRYIKNGQLLEYTEMIVSTQNIYHKNNPVAGMKIKYTLSDDKDKNFTVDSEHTAVQVVVQGTYQILFTNSNSGFGRVWQVLVKKNSDGSYEIADWFMGHGGYDEGIRGEYIEFGDAEFWNTSEKYEQLLSDTRESCKKLSEKLTSEYGSISKSYITHDEAKICVAKHSNVKESEIFDFECSLLETDGTLAFYEIRFKTEGYEYYYKLVAQNGYVYEYSKQVEGEAEAEGEIEVEEQINELLSDEGSDESIDLSCDPIYSDVAIMESMGADGGVGSYEDLSKEYLSLYDDLRLLRYEIVQAYSPEEAYKLKTTTYISGTLHFIKYILSMTTLQIGNLMNSYICHTQETLSSNLKIYLHILSGTDL